MPSFISLLLNIGVIGAHVAFQSLDPQISYLIGMATFTSFLVLISLGVGKKVVYSEENKFRITFSVIIEALICGALVGVSFVSFSEINSSIFLGLNLGIYLFFLIFK